DIPILTKFFIEKFNEKLGRNVENVSNEVMKIFFEYDWEGNVRELEHLLEGIMSIYDVKTIEVEHLTSKFRNYKKNIRQNGTKSLKETLEDTEKNIILNALKTNNENITHTAEMLKIPRQTLQYKINKYNLK